MTQVNSLLSVVYWRLEWRQIYVGLSVACNHVQLSKRICNSLNEQPEFVKPIKNWLKISEGSYTYTQRPDELQRNR